MSKKKKESEKTQSRIRVVERSMMFPGIMLEPILGASSGSCDCGTCACQTQTSRNSKVGDVKAVKNA